MVKGAEEWIVVEVSGGEDYSIDVRFDVAV